MSDSEFHPVYRILDASANRVSEGLRTIEEWARFAENNSQLTRELKNIRHAVSETLLVVPRSRLIESRDTPGDVGTRLEAEGEYQRRSTNDVLVAAVSRTGQSLRVLEEYLKTIDQAAARSIEQARYRFYTVSTLVENVAAQLNRRLMLAEANLYVLVECESSEAAFAKKIEALGKAGVDLFQLRDSRSDDRTRISQARIGTQVANELGALFIMNDRADLAYASRCDGVHVGQAEMPVEIARQIVGSDRLVGCSTHHLYDATNAMEQGADYLGCGPVFPSQTKSFVEFAGLDYLREIAQQQQAGQLTMPCFAIGGIDSSNVNEIVRTGILRIAVSAAVANAMDPEETVRELKSALCKT